MRFLIVFMKPTAIHATKKVDKVNDVYLKKKFKLIAITFVRLRC